MLIRDLSRADVAEAARLHRMVFGDTMGGRLGRRYAERFLSWHVELSEGIALRLPKEGRIAGYVFGAPSLFATATQRALLPYMVVGVLSHPTVLLHSNFLRTLPRRVRHLIRGGATSSDQDTVGHDVFALVAIGVHPDRRGQGVATRLLQEFEARVSSAGFTRMILDVYDTNVAARMAYERSGWQPHQRFGHVVRYGKHVGAGQ